MRSLHLPAAAIATAFVFGCGDGTDVSAPTPGAGPAISAQVDRFEQPLIISFGSEDPPITAIVGVSCDDFPAFCAGADPQLVAHTMVVTHPTAHGGTSEHILTRAQDVPAFAWPIDLGPGGDACTLLDVPPYVGTVNAFVNDNEGQFFVTAPGANAFSIRFAGNVANPETGERAHLAGAVHIVVLPDGTFKFLPNRFLVLKPIGK